MSRAKRCGDFPVLCDEMMVEVLSRLPLRPLHRLKWVSKQWHSLITNQILPIIIRKDVRRIYVYSLSKYRKSPPSQAQQITHEGNKISLIWSYATPADEVVPFDDCNGLFLREDFPSNCSRCRRMAYVFNPTTGSNHLFRQAPTTAYGGYYTIGYDPWVSPHFMVVYLQSDESEVDCVSTFDTSELLVYSSESLVWRRQSTGNIKLPGFTYHCCTAFWNGSLYLVIQPDEAGERTYILRVDYLTATTRGRVDGVSEIKLPEGCRGSISRDGLCVGRMGKKLCCSELHRNQLRIWSLLEGAGKKIEWVLMHESQLQVSELEGSEGLEHDEYGPSFSAFDPSLDAIYVLFYGRVFMYYIESRKFEMLSNLEPEIDDIKVFYAQVYPFEECSLDPIY